MSIRDIAAAKWSGELAKLGEFDTEFTMYGCGYVEDGKIKYRVSSDALTIYDFIEASNALGIYPTGVSEKTEICKVPSGQRENIAQEVKIELAREIRETYSKEFLFLLNQLGNREHNNDAYPILKLWQEKLEGVFDEERLTLFDQSLRLVYRKKVLNKDSYQEFLLWIAKNRKQMEDDVVVKDIIEKNFYGFAHEAVNGEIKYICSALKREVYQKKAMLDRQGMMTTPILNKTYWFDRISNVAQVREQFLVWLKNSLTIQYIEFLRYISQLSPFITEIEFNECRRVIEKGNSKDELEDFDHYGYLWNLIKG